MGDVQRRGGYPCEAPRGAAGCGVEYVQEEFDGARQRLVRVRGRQDDVIHRLDARTIAPPSIGAPDETSHVGSSRSEHCVDSSLQSAGRPTRRDAARRDDRVSYVRALRLRADPLDGVAR
jgi:hypothetical protein